LNFLDNPMNKLDDRARVVAAGGLGACVAPKTHNNWATSNRRASSDDSPDSFSLVDVVNGR
jgi:hypothetical protein